MNGVGDVRYAYVYAGTQLRHGHCGARGAVSRPIWIWPVSCVGKPRLKRFGLGAGEG